MFDKLIETGNKGSAKKIPYFVGAIILHVVILGLFGAYSVMAYNASVDALNSKIPIVWIPKNEPTPKPNVPRVTVRPTTPRHTSGGENTPGPVRLPTVTKNAVENILNPTKVPDKISAEPSKAVEVPKTHFVFGSTNSPGSGIGLPSPTSGNGTGTGAGTDGNEGKRVVVPDGEAPPPLPRKTLVVSKGVINGSATFLSTPVITSFVRNAVPRGTYQVTVKVRIGKDGNVEEILSTSNSNPLLVTLAAKAAKASKFSPTKLSGEPVKVEGSIVYNFKLD